MGFQKNKGEPCYGRLLSCTFWLPRNLYCRKHLRADPRQSRWILIIRILIIKIAKPVPSICLHFGLLYLYLLPVSSVKNVGNENILPRNLTVTILKSTVVIYILNAFKVGNTGQIVAASFNFYSRPWCLHASLSFLLMKCVFTMF